MATEDTVFVDTAILMYAGGAPHPLRGPCRTLLEDVAAGEIRGVTSVEVIQELLHRFGATSTIGRRMARSTLDLFAPVLPVTHAVMARVLGLAGRYEHLSARDLVHVATCREEDIPAIASPDRGFEDVEGLRRIDRGGG